MAGLEIHRANSMTWQKQALHGEISEPERISHPVRHKVQQLFADATFASLLVFFGVVYVNWEACDHSAADVAAGGCSYAGTINLVHTGTTCFADLRDHAVRLIKRRGRHGLRRRCDRQRKGSNSDQPDHWLLPCLGFNE